MQPSRPRLRSCGALLAAAFACGPREPPRPPDPEVRTAGEPPADATIDRLRTVAQAGGRLYWRLPGPEGPRCEPWRLVPDGGDPERGRLVLDDRPIDPPVPEAIDATAAPVPADIDATVTPAPPDSPALRFAYRIAEGHLSLTAPEHERPVPAVPGDSHAVGTALTCVFAGLALTSRGPDGPARQLVLDAHERFFLDPAACAAAGPREDPPGPDELRPLGCAAALADPATRARLADPTHPPGAVDPTALLRRRRWLYVLRRGPDGDARCEAWRHRPNDDDPHHGLLSHRDRDERGAFTRHYAYEAAPGVLTLQGPTEVWRPRIAGHRAEAVRAHGCLITRPVAALAPAAIAVGPEPWYLSRSACEAARASGAPPLPAPSCD